MRHTRYSSHRIAWYGTASSSAGSTSTSRSKLPKRKNRSELIGSGLFFLRGGKWLGGWVLVGWVLIGSNGDFFARPTRSHKNPPELTRTHKPHQNPRLRLPKLLNLPKFPKVSAISMPRLFELKKKFISFVI
jgi:hypothetical protein